MKPTHHVTVTTLASWLAGHLGVDATAGMSVLDWLLAPQQKLLGVVAGAVYADALGTLGSLRQALAWYPDQLWRWLLGCQWGRLAQEEAFVARTAEVGDETGSAVTAARLVRDMMRLALMLQRRYAPYQKWLGTAFARGHHGDGLPEHLTKAVHARDVTARESALAKAYTALAHCRNAAALTNPVDASIGNYHSRPARVLMAGRFTEACLATVTDPMLRQLPLLGGIDQVVDSTDVLEHPRRCRRLASLYTPAARSIHPRRLGQDASASAELRPWSPQEVSRDHYLAAVLGEILVDAQQRATLGADQRQRNVLGVPITACWPERTLPAGDRLRSDQRHGSIEQATSRGTASGSA